MVSVIRYVIYDWYVLHYNANRSNMLFVIIIVLWTNSFTSGCWEWASSSHKLSNWTRRFQSLCNYPWGNILYLIQKFMFSRIRGSCLQKNKITHCYFLYKVIFLGEGSQNKLNTTQPMLYMKLLSELRNKIIPIRACGMVGRSGLRDHKI